MARARRNREPGLRQLRVGEQLRHILAESLGRGEIIDPALQAMSVTITEVRPSPDLKQATVYIVPLGGAALEETLAALERSRPLLQGVIGRNIRMKFTPRLEFRHDDRFDQADKMDRLLRSPKVQQDLG